MCKCAQWDPEVGPSEVPHFAQGTGLVPNSTAYRHLYTNWSLTTTRALAAVQVCLIKYAWVTLLVDLCIQIYDYVCVCGV